MRNSIKFSFLATFVSIVSFSFIKESNTWDLPIKEYISFEKNNFDINVLQLKKQVEQNDTTLKTTYLKLRNAFKKLEPFWEYADPIGVKDFVNGAPLPKIERKAPSLIIKEPQGLQVIDELIFEDTLNKSELITQLDLLIAYTKNQGLKTEFSLRELIEISREQLIRIFTLGLTGFDTPASGESISDAIASLQTIQFVQNQLNEILVNVEATKINKLNAELLLKCMDALKTTKNVNDIDHFTILTTYLNPLFENYATLQKVSDIETYLETSGTRKPFNYTSSNFFNADFLNPESYTTIPNEMLSDSLTLLGEKLFNDTRLSNSKLMSCATCHNSKLAYTDGKITSVANTNENTHNRNAPSLSYAIYAERFFWDLRAHNIEDQIEHVFHNPKEFNSTVLDIANFIQNDKEYATWFKSAFGKWYPQSINKTTIGYAFASFVKSLPKHNSNFDRYVQKKDIKLDKSVQKGFNLFMGKAKCGTCHFAPIFSGLVPPSFEESETEVLGVPKVYGVKKPSLDLDLGRYNATLKDNANFMQYAFKTPTVRNVSLTAPYMHNGSFKTLEQVMEFYNNGGGHGLGFELENQTLSRDKLNLSKKEIKDVIAFLHSLTDKTVNKY